MRVRGGGDGLERDCSCGGKHRDRVNAAVMEDPRIAEMMQETEQVIDCGRMAYGGFRTIVQLAREPEHAGRR